MPARSWADGPRLEFLKAHLPGYEAAQERRKTRTFLADMHDKYFAKFPQPNESLLLLEKKRVSTWMNNHSGGRGRNNGALLRATRVNFRELLRGKLDEKRRQKLQSTQAYSELYWKSKLKDIVLNEWNKKIEEEPNLPKKNYLAYMNMRVRQLYEAESENVKAEVQHYRLSAPHDSMSSSMLMPDEDQIQQDEKSRRIEAREVQLAIDSVESILTEIVKDIEDIAGLKSHFLLCGPEPKRNGNMVMFTISSGKTISSNRSFKDHPTYKTEVHDKFFSFARGCYTREDRMKYTDVPFPRSVDSVRMTSEDMDPGPSTQSASNVTRKPAARKQIPISKYESDTSLESDSDDDESHSHGEPTSLLLEKVNTTIEDDEEHDEMDIFSHLLPPHRRVVDSKESGGLTLYRTQDGQWLSEAELHRMANIARNSHLMKGLGVDEAMRQLITRPRGQGNVEPEAEDNREFTTSRSRTVLEPRIRHPRRSKENISYGEKKDDAFDLSVRIDSVSVSACAGPDNVVSGNSDVAHPMTGDSLSTQVVSGNSDISGNIVPELGVATLPSEVSAPVDGDSYTPASHDVSMEVDNNASLDDTSPPPPGLSLASSSQDPVQIMDLNVLDLSKIPVWLQLPLKHLRTHFRGELEDKVLGAFIALEMAWQPLEKRIGTNGRPQAVTWWIKNARPIDKVPHSIDLSSFPGQVRDWWRTIQPQWRVPLVDDWPLPQQIPAGELWQEARLGGSNGLFLIILCLYWWRKTAEEEFDKVATAEYISVAEDVVFVFDAILTSGISQLSSHPLAGSARVNARSIAKKAARNATPRTPKETVGKTRTLRSSSAKENAKAPRARRAHANT